MIGPRKRRPGVGTTHYSLALDTEELHKWAENMALKVAKKTAELGPMTLCYAGMSGTAHATALALACHRLDPDMCVGMVYVRKEEEQSHGLPLEYSYPANSHKHFIFVDDHISSGNTFKRVKGAVEKRWPNANVFTIALIFNEGYSAMRYNVEAL